MYAQLEDTLELTGNKKFWSKLRYKEVFVSEEQLKLW